MKRVLILGGAGFIGSHTTDIFLQQGLEVVVFDNLSNGKINHLNVFHPNLRIQQADILNTPALLKEVSVSDLVIHLAALPSVVASIENPIQSITVNTLGFVQVLEAIRASQKPIRLIYASSAAVYGAVSHLPCSDEKLIEDPVLSPYALDKLNNEHYADLYFRLFGIKSIGLRYFNVYGPRQAPDSTYAGVIAKFIEQYKSQQPLTVFGDGSQSRDFIHVKDVAWANWLSANCDYCGVVNIGTGQPHSLIDLIKYLEAEGGYAAHITHAPSREGDIAASYATITKAKDKLTFNYTISFKEGLQSLL